MGTNQTIEFNIPSQLQQKKFYFPRNFQSIDHKKLEHSRILKSFHGTVMIENCFIKISSLPKKHWMTWVKKTVDRSRNENLLEKRCQTKREKM